MRVNKTLLNINDRMCMSRPRAADMNQGMPQNHYLVNLVTTALARPKQLTIGGPTSDPLRVHKTVTFEELVPIRPREHGRRARGQWVWFDALDLCLAAEAWKQTGWQQARHVMFRLSRYEEMESIYSYLLILLE